VRPDYVVEIRPDVLAEHDGPTLQHALQGLHGEVIGLPRRRSERPSPDLLEGGALRALSRGCVIAWPSKASRSRHAKGPTG
jgi:hypothetical protein